MAAALANVGASIMQRRLSINGRRVRASCLLLTLFGFFDVALAERLPLKSYTVAEGLPHNTVNKIVRDSRGFLWFCTEEGLSRFDGYTFTNYGTKDGLPHSAVEDFLETRGGELWLATGAGLVRFNPKGTPTAGIVSANETRGGDSPMFTVIVPENEDRRARYISVLVEGDDGTIWAGTRQGVYRLERGDGHLRLHHVEMKWPGEIRPVIWDLVQDHHGTLWAAHPGGLSRRWPDGSAANFTMRDGLPDNHIHDLFQDYRGQLWAGTRAQGFFGFTTDETHKPPSINFTFAVRDLQQTEWINELFETSDHKLWAATANGLIEFLPDGDGQGRRYRLYTKKNGLRDNGVTALNEDKGGNLWLGSYGAGAMKLARDGFVSFGEPDGLLSVYAIFGDRTGGTCFRAGISGDERKSVFEGAQPNFQRPLEKRHTRYGCFDGRSFTVLKPDVLDNNDLGWVGEGVTLQARNGEWWLGTGAGLYRFPVTDNFEQLKSAQPIAIYTSKDGLAAPQVFRLFEDSHGNIWVSTIGVQNGLARWERARETWQDFSNAPGLPLPKDDLARAFAEDSAGNVWIGFSGGAARYRDGRFTFFTEKDGLPPGSVMNFYTDRAARLWLTSARSGLVRVDDPGAQRPVFNNYTTADGLSSNSTEAIAEDLSGRIYVSTGRGLDRLDPATGRFKHFTTADGLAAGQILAAFRDRSGVLWFGTWNGLSRLTPSADDGPAKPPPILITGLSVAGQRHPVSALGDTQISLPDLAADRNQLQIDFVALSFAAGEVLRYQYKLESDAEWSVPAEQRTVNFANLAPGRYRFMVRGVNSDGASSVPATITFRVLSPVWQRPWFLALAALAAALVVYALYRYRVAQLLKVERVRTRIATDLHDDIGANLTKIAILSEVAKRQRGNGDEAPNSPLSAIARISRESASSMSDIVWAINPRRDRLLDLVRRMRQHAEELFALRDIELTFDVSGAEQNLAVGIDVRRDLLLIFKEATNNAARHSRCTRVEIHINVEGPWLSLRVTDNGAGFDTLVGSDGEGLASMRQRAEKLGGELEVNSLAGEGTTVSARIPVARSRAFHRTSYPTQTGR